MNLVNWNVILTHCCSTELRYLSYVARAVIFPFDSSSCPLLSALRFTTVSTLQSTYIYDSQYFASALETDENRPMTCSLDTFTKIARWPAPLTHIPKSPDDLLPWHIYQNRPMTCSLDTFTKIARWPVPLTHLPKSLDDLLPWHIYQNRPMTCSLDTFTKIARWPAPLTHIPKSPDDLLPW